MKNRLFNLFRANAKRGSFKADGNTIYLYDVIVSSEADAEWLGGVSLEAFSKQLASMTGPVELRINSPGGDVFAGIAMAQVIREYKGDITAHVDGYAASAASIVAIAAGKTIMAPASMMMIHKAWTIALGNADDLLRTAEVLEKIDSQLAKSYADRAGTEPAMFAALMAEETWFDAEEAVEIGLADEVASDESEVVEARSKWDLSAFEKAPAPPREDVAAKNAAAATEAEKKIQAEIEHRQRMLAVRLLQTAA